MLRTLKAYFVLVFLNRTSRYLCRNVHFITILLKLHLSSSHGSHRFCFGTRVSASLCMKKVVGFISQTENEEEEDVKEKLCRWESYINNQFWTHCACPPKNVGWCFFHSTHLHHHSNVNPFFSFFVISVFAECWLKTSGAGPVRFQYQFSQNRTLSWSQFFSSWSFVFFFSSIFCFCVFFVLYFEITVQQGFNNL